MIQFFYRSAIVFASLTAIFLSDICFAETRYALVIGNGGYSSAKLTSPLLDAEAMEKKLMELNYNVAMSKDLNREQFNKEIRKFEELLKKGDSTGFFYYSGHGMQVNGTNYMIPVDAEILSENDIEDYGIRIDSVLKRMTSTHSNPNIIVLDSCRNNPFEKSVKNASNGLAVMPQASPGTLIAFAAAPGRVARQSPGGLSPYTAELLNQLDKVDLTLIPLFQAVQNAVWAATAGDQHPHIELSANLHDIVLHPRSTPDSNKKVFLEARMLFSLDEVTLNSESQKTLDDLIVKLEKIKYNTIVAIGYASRLEDDRMPLSMLRATAVKAYLEKKGIPADKIFVDGKGENHPVTSDSCKGNKRIKELIECLHPDSRVEVEVAGVPKISYQ